MIYQMTLTNISVECTAFSAQLRKKELEKARRKSYIVYKLAYSVQRRVRRRKTKSEKRKTIAQNSKLENAFVCPLKYTNKNRCQISLLKEIKKKKTTKQGIFLNEIEELANILSSNILTPEEKKF